MLTPLLDPKISIEDRDGRPCLVSGRFGDLYFAAQDGLAETELVFLSGNDLPNRMEGQWQFTVAETGFGTGLNFLALLHHWRRLEDHPDQTAPLLHYITTEIAPLDSEVIKEVLSPYQDLSGLVDEMLAILPPRWPGRHRRHLFGGRVVVDFLYGDSLEMIQSSNFKADAWFLDGFAPSVNPDMWQDGLFEALASHSAPQATLASFTAAGHVRRGLEASGFTIHRLPGFGHKRHRITGQFSLKSQQTSAEPIPHANTPKKVVIIGAGIAGASVAAALKPRGDEMLVLGQGDGAGDGSSGNIAAVQSPRLTAADSFSERLSLTGYSYARWLARFHGVDLARQAISYAWNDREVTRQEKIKSRDWPDTVFSTPLPSELKEQTGLDIAYPGLLFPDGGAVDPKALTHALLDGVNTQFNTTVTGFTPLSGGGWHIETGQGAIEADLLVLAAGSGLAALTQDWLDPLLPLQVTAGRVSHMPSSALASALTSTLNGEELNHAISFGGYMAKAKDGQIALGASFDRHVDMNAPPPIDDDLHNANIETLPPAVAASIDRDFTTWSGRVSFRLASKDRSPIAGDLGNGLYVIAALGARGMVTGPILGQYIASLIMQTPSPLDRGAASLVDPYRFSAKEGL